MAVELFKISAYNYLLATSNMLLAFAGADAGTATGTLAAQTGYLSMYLLFLHKCNFINYLDIAAHSTCFEQKYMRTHFMQFQELFGMIN